MTRTLLDRCAEVQTFLDTLRTDKNLLAHALLASGGEDKFQYVVACLKTELRMHQEVRQLWPYLLLIPDSEQCINFCSMYDSSLEQFGRTVDEQISRVQNSLDTLAAQLGQPEVSPFWQSVREELIQQVCREAQIMLAQSS